MTKLIIKPGVTQTYTTTPPPDVNLVEPIFKGEDVFIVAGGPSLTNFDFNRLRGKNVIAINKAIFYVPIDKYKTISYFSDYRFMEWYKQDLIKIDCKKYTIGLRIPKEIAITLKNSGKTGLDLRNGYVKHGGNSGYAAINLALHLGVNRIILLGYDMQKVGNETHFHGGYSDKNDRIKANNELYKKFAEPFASITETLREQHIEIYNTSMQSALNNIIKVPIDNFL